jgi:hypothetical protein
MMKAQAGEPLREIKEQPEITRQKQTVFWYGRAPSPYLNNLIHVRTE